MASLCHPWFTTTTFSYRFPIFETSATALCGTTGIYIYTTISRYLPLYIIHYPLSTHDISIFIPRSAPSPSTGSSIAGIGSDWGNSSSSKSTGAKPLEPLRWWLPWWNPWNALVKSPHPAGICGCSSLSKNYIIYRYWCIAIWRGAKITIVQRILSKQGTILKCTSSLGMVWFHFPSSNQVPALIADPVFLVILIQPFFIDLFKTVALWRFCCFAFN